MNDPTNVIIAMMEAQSQVREGEAWAVAVSDSGRWASPQYWDEPFVREVFEKLVAHECNKEHDTAVVFVTPVIVADVPQQIDFRSPLDPLGEDDREELFGLAIDTNNGFDVLRCPITRDDDGLPSFGDIEILEGQCQLTPTTPGFQLLQAMIAA